MVVPIDVASLKEEICCQDDPPKIMKRLEDFLDPIRRVRPYGSSLQGLRLAMGGKDLGKQLSPKGIDRLLEKMAIDRSVCPSPCFEGGQQAALRNLDRFLRTRLDRYHLRTTQRLRRPRSLVLTCNFGCISRGAGGNAEFGDRLAVWRGFYRGAVRAAGNWRSTSWHVTQITTRSSPLPDWARKTLQKHRRDRRPYPLLFRGVARRADA